MKLSKVKNQLFVDFVSRKVKIIDKNGKIRVIRFYMDYDSVFGTKTLKIVPKFEKYCVV